MARRDSLDPERHEAKRFLAPFPRRTLIMTKNDDSLLSAYLDGELPPDQHLLVESALVSDPQLGEELRSLTSVRDLLAGLPRSTGVDLTARVRDRIGQKTRLRKIRAILPGSIQSLRLPARAAGFLGIAAGLLLAIVLSFAHWNRPASLPNQAGLPVAETSPRAVSATPPTDSLDPSESDWPLLSPDPKLKSPSEIPLAQGSTASGRPATRTGPLEHVHQYLDNPDLHQMFLISDPTDPSAPSRVASVVEQTTRFNYYKITISQGIVIDPRHPDEAMVFALVVNSSELNTLRDRLQTVFHDRVEETAADPKVVTQLADIVQVKAFPPAPIGEVVIPREALALRTPVADVQTKVSPEPVPDQPIDRDRPTPEQERSSPAADLATLKNFVVLVWVSRPHSG